MYRPGERNTFYTPRWWHAVEHEPHVTNPVQGRSPRAWRAGPARRQKVCVVLKTPPPEPRHPKQAGPQDLALRRGAESTWLTALVSPRLVDVLCHLIRVPFCSLGITTLDRGVCVAAVTPAA